MYRYHYLVSAKFVFGNDLNVVCNPSKEDLEFVEGVSILISLFGRLVEEVPFYKLYHNKTSRDFMKAVEV